MTHKPVQESRAVAAAPPRAGRGAAGTSGDAVPSPRLAALLERAGDDRRLTREARDALTPAEIIELMRLGNDRFRRGEPLERDFLREQEESAGAQYPAAILLTCIDSRAPAEIIMDIGIGRVFNARLAGNIADSSVIGSMEFACKVAGAKVVLVMGHTGCGAVTGAIEGVRLGKLTDVLAQIEPAIAATEFTGDRTAANPAFVDAVARTNVMLMMERIRRESPVLDELVGEGKLAIAGAMYDLKSGRVEFC